MKSISKYFNTVTIMCTDYYYIIHTAKQCNSRFVHFEVYIDEKKEEI